MRKPPLALLVAALLLPLSACSDDGTGNEDDPGYFGTYELRTVNGSALPFTLLDNPVQKVEIIRGSIVVRADGTFTDGLEYRVTPAGGTAAPSDDVVIGTFLESAGSLVFNTSDGATYSVLLTANGGLSQEIDEYVLVYGR